jgi:hypothetical protein
VGWSDGGSGLGESATLDEARVETGRIDRVASIAADDILDPDAIP